MKFAWIKEQRHTSAVKLMCQVLAVSTSGFYAWLGRRPSRQAQRRDILLKRIDEVHRASRQLYGSPRVHRDHQSWGS